jgi:hypothetical protein
MYIENGKKPEGKGPLQRCSCREEDTTKMDLKEIR